MKKLIFAVIFLALPASAYASSASSTVINNINTSSTNSNSQVTSHTDITVETDGKTTHYTSDEPNKTVHVESNNGTSKIEVNGNDVSGDDEKTSPTDTSTPTPTKEKGVSETVTGPRNFFEKLLDQLERPFRMVFFRLHRS